jgi:NAD(P)-dependent dehydrogenase (short-subunit alcohol dehydrogenase family)
MAKSILPLIPLGRLGEPGDIARAVVFLAADEASHRFDAIDQRRTIHELSEGEERRGDEL